MNIARIAGAVYLVTFLTGSFALFVGGGIAPVAMAVASLSSFLSPSTSRALSPYIYGPGLIGEGALTLWLLVFGVDAPKWHFMNRTEIGAHR